MIVGLCIPGPETHLDVGLLRDVERRVASVRVDVPDETDHRHPLTWDQARALREVPEILPVYLVAGGTMRRHDGAAWSRDGLLAAVEDQAIKLDQLGVLDTSAIEIGNEPDIAAKEWKKNPRELSTVFVEAYRIIRRYSSKALVLSPSVSNLNRRGIDYLEAMRPGTWPEDVGVAFHRYPPSHSAVTPHRGFSYREDELAAVRQLACGRPIYCTEHGWAQQNGGYELTEDEVADRLEYDLRLFAREGVSGAWPYQINSAKVERGDSDDVRRLKTYGVRRADGTWKPAADRIAALRKELA